ncbi:MAG: SPOR domain-containing protein [Bacteroidetes bacterium]|nr:SPOR domain-containing protein [Bacteroidota bacterium]
MRRALIYLIVLVSLLTLSLLSSCSSTGDDEEIYVLRDTVILNVDTLIKETRNIQKLNLKFVVQLAAFKEMNYAEAYKDKVKEKLNVVPDIRKTGDVYHVTVGKFNDAASAQDYLNFVKSKGFTNAFVKSTD